MKILYLFFILIKWFNRNISAHYLTERKDLYKKYCHNNKNCDLVIFPDNHSSKINNFRVPQIDSRVYD